MERKKKIEEERNGGEEGRREEEEKSNSRKPVTTPVLVLTKLAVVVSVTIGYKHITPSEETGLKDDPLFIALFLASSSFLTKLERKRQKRDSDCHILCLCAAVSLFVSHASINK